jgi:hypothetical protein
MSLIDRNAGTRPPRWQAHYPTPGPLRCSRSALAFGESVEEGLHFFSTLGKFSELLDELGISLGLLQLLSAMQALVHMGPNPQQGRIAAAGGKLFDSFLSWAAHGAANPPQWQPDERSLADVEGSWSRRCRRHWHSPSETKPPWRPFLRVAFRHPKKRGPAMRLGVAHATQGPCSARSHPTMTPAGLAHRRTGRHGRPTQSCPASSNHILCVGATQSHASGTREQHGRIPGIEPPPSYGVMRVLHASKQRSAGARLHGGALLLLDTYPQRAGSFSRDGKKGKKVLGKAAQNGAAGLENHPAIVVA